MDLSNIKDLIATFRLETEKNSISPDRVGYLLLLLTSIFDDIQNLVKEGDNALNKDISALQSTLQVVQTAIDALRGDKQDNLTPGRGIAISDNVISCTLDTEVFRLVSELPAQDVDENKIYLVAVAGDDAEDNNVYQEWHYKGGEWELIGARKVEVNLTPYLTKDDAVKMYQPKGEYASQADHDELSEFVELIDDSVAEHLNNEDIHITQAEKSAISIYPFDGIVYNAQEAVTAGYGIAYCIALGRFISVEGDSYKDLPLPYNSRADEYSDYKAVSGCLFRKGDELYSFNGETLVKKYAGADELRALETACAESVYVLEIDTAGGVMSVAERDKMLAAKAVVIKEGYGYYHPYYMSNETIMASHAYTDGESNAETGVIQEAIILLSAVEGDATMLNYTVKVCVKSIGSGGETADLSGYVEKSALATINGHSLLDGGDIAISGGGDTVNISPIADAVIDEVLMR